LLLKILSGRNSAHGSTGFLLNVGLRVLERTTFLPHTDRCRKALCSEHSRGETHALSTFTNKCSSSGLAY